MTDEFNLSEKIEDLIFPIDEDCPRGAFCNYIHLTDVKEFIRRLKLRKCIIQSHKGKINGIILSIEDLDKLAGDELSK